MTTTSKQLQTLFKGLSPKTYSGVATSDAPITKFSISHMATKSWIPEEKDGKPVGSRLHQAYIHFEVIFCDLAMLADVAVVLSTTPNAEIDRVDWRLTDITKQNLGTEARKAALRDAIQRAGDYAMVVGRNVVATEIDKEYSSTSARTMQTARVATRFNGLSVEPQDVELHASITLKFVAE